MTVFFEFLTCFVVIVALAGVQGQNLLGTADFAGGAQYNRRKIFLWFIRRLNIGEPPEDLALIILRFSNVKSTNEPQEDLAPSVKWEVKDKDITFQVSCPVGDLSNKKRWIGLGFHSDRRLKNEESADFYFASLDSAGANPTYQDSYISLLEIQRKSQFLVHKDDISNMDIVDPITRNESTISVKFSRKLNTCDKADWLLSSGTTFMIIACGSTMGTMTNADGTTSPLLIPDSPNTWYRIAPQQLFTENVVAVFDPASPNWKITMNNLNPWPQFSGPAWADPKLYYACKLAKLPAYEEVRSIIGYSQVTDLPSPAIVTMHLRMCKKDVNVAVAEPWATSTINCQPNLKEVESLLADCSETLVSWFPDSKAYRFPNKIGYPVGKAEYADRFVLLQVVYDTTAAAPPTGSLTGIQLHFSDEKVDQKSSVVTVSSSSSIGLIIPPKQSEFRIRTFCDVQCTNKFLPNGGINLFSVVHQTRKLGREVRTRLIRNGKEVQLISEDVSHSSTFQVPRAISPPVRVQPGDQILVECTFNSAQTIPQMTDEVPVFGGIASVDEICAASFRYYPRIEGFFTCGSSVEPRHVFPILGVSDYESFFNVTGNGSQYMVTPAAVKEQFQLKELKLKARDNCLVPRIHNLYYNKRHLPSCGIPNLSPFSTANIELLALAAPQCSGDPALKNYDNPLPTSCSDTVYQDEIDNQIMCRKNSVGIIKISFFLTVFSFVFSAFYNKNF